MSAKVHVDAGLADKVLGFFRTEGIAMELADGDPCDVRILICSDRRESDLRTIYSGGWIACETAWAVAKKLGLAVPQMGRLLTRLNVKTCRCALGCFQ